MNFIAMTACLFLALPLAAQQSNDVKLSEAQARAGSLVATENATEKNDPCAKAENNDTRGNCLQKELAATDRNYHEFVLAVGAYTRALIASGGHPAVGRLPFDTGETAWMTYRTQTCTSVYQTQYGGTAAAGDQLSCEILLTRNHMRELAFINDLGPIQK